jgi:hypothetical protein
MSSFRMFHSICSVLCNYLIISLKYISLHNQTNLAIMMNALPTTVIEISHLMSSLRNSSQCFTCPCAHLLSQIKLTSMQHTVIMFLDYLFCWNRILLKLLFCAVHTCFGIIKNSLVLIQIIEIKLPTIFKSEGC